MIGYRWPPGAVATLVVGAGVDRVALPQRNAYRLYRLRAVNDVRVRLGGDDVTATSADLDLRDGETIIACADSCTHVSALGTTSGAALEVCPVEPVR